MAENVPGDLVNRDHNAVPDCPICGTNNFEEEYHDDSPGWSDTFYWTYYCNNCKKDVWFLDPMMPYYGPDHPYDGWQFIEN